jgi:hypothetical protein
MRSRQLGGAAALTQVRLHQIAAIAAIGAPLLRTVSDVIGSEAPGNLIKPPRERSIATTNPK